MHVWRNVEVEVLLCDLFKVKIFEGGAFDLVVNPLYGLFVCVLLPDAVAAHQNEINVVSQFKHVGVWVSCDGLLLWSQVLDLLVLKITERPAQVEVAVDTPLFCDFAASVFNSVFLDGVVRFVIFAHFNGFFVTA